jgi:hypothetical protein
MKPEAALAPKTLSFGVIFIAFGVRNLVVNPAIGLQPLAAMAVLFGGLLSGVAGILRHHPAPYEAET